MKIWTVTLAEKYSFDSRTEKKDYEVEADNAVTAIVAAKKVAARQYKDSQTFYSLRYPLKVELDTITDN